jgi:diacylglycerol kinase family enzyme
MTAGVLINPHSGKGNDSGFELAKRLEDATYVKVRLLHAFSDISVYLDEFARTGITDIFISSGDGTIQEVQTIIAEMKLFEHQPRLCLLPHGTTNMTAADIGFRSRNVAAQAEFIRQMNVADCVHQPTLRVVNPRTADRATACFSNRRCDARIEILPGSGS